MLYLKNKIIIQNLNTKMIKVYDFNNNFPRKELRNTNTGNRGEKRHRQRKTEEGKTEEATKKKKKSNTQMREREEEKKEKDLPL